MPVSSQSLRPIKGEQLAAVRDLFAAGLDRAAASLSAMVGSAVTVIDGRVEVVPLAGAAALAGAPDASTVAIYLGITGGLSAHIVLLFAPSDAARLAELLLGPAAAGSMHDEALRESALGEVGNVMGSSFAVVLGDRMGTPLWSTPPTVRTDMARALVDGLVVTVGGQQDTILVVATQFARCDAEPQFSVQGTFLVIPEPDGLTSLFDAVSQA